MLNIVDADVHNSLIIRRSLGRRNHSLRLNSRKVLWDWNSPYALLAERGTRTDWWATLYELKNLFEHTTQGCEEPNRPYITP